MKEFFRKTILVFQDRILRRRIAFTLLGLVIFRVLSSIPIPSVDALRLQSFFSNNEFLGLLNLFSGGGLSNLSLVMLGVGPYINASIIMQLLTIMFPKLKALYQEEGEAGRKKFSQYSRMLTVPLALLQSFGFLKLLESNGVITHLTSFDFLINVMVVTAGSLLLMWIGELITEFGIGNGISLIIFGGIVASIPSLIGQLIFTFEISQLPLYLVLFAFAIFVIAGVVIITEAERPVPITYAKRIRGNKVYGGLSTYLPLRLNQAGVIPIIFALSFLLFPQLIAQFLTQVDSEILRSIASSVVSLLNNTWLHASLYFLLVFAFTYFYTALTFDPFSIATNLQKNGAFIPGVRPGTSTADHLARILTRLTLVGALFLGFIAVLPSIIQATTGVASLTIGGTALLIAVSVIIDLIKKIDSQVSIREY
ncbi:MAG: preprotein translocase subunit SecY [Patescibacteria group bacterium]